MADSHEASHTPMGGVLLLSHFTTQEMKAQRGKTAWLAPHSGYVGESGVSREPGSGISAPAAQYDFSSMGVARVTPVPSFLKCLLI